MDAKVPANELQSFDHTDRLFAIAGIPDAFVAVDGRKFGRRSAGSGFLEAVCRYCDKEEYALAVVSDADLQLLHFAMSQYEGSSPSLNSFRLGDQSALARSGALFVPSPSVRDYVWTRRLHSQDAYSLVGITHTIATLQATPMLCNFFIEPFEPWDALICTSEAAKRAIQNQHANYLEYLEERGISAPNPRIQLPVIPLGVHCDQFERSEDRKKNALKFRDERGIGEDDVVLLSFGRIDPAAKAHPVPLYIAAELAQIELGTEQKIHLVMAGTVPGGKAIENEIRQAAKCFAPDLSVFWVDGSDDRLCETVWHAADIFVSLSDNIQESFGLTPVEAMAAGLPCVVSDWNGYKETVVDRETGFRIPTLMPDIASGIGSNLANRYCSFNDNEVMYLYGVSQVTAVDVGKCAEAIMILAADKDLRQRMGAAALRRVETHFSWEKIIPQYRELLAELGDVRRRSQLSDTLPRTGGCIRPDLADPLRMFGDYPTAKVDFDRQVVTSKTYLPKMLEDLSKQPMCTLTMQGMTDPRSMRLIINSALQQPQSINELCRLLPQSSPAKVMSTCMWLAKYGILEFQEART
ncbi:glycosyltransferase family 4 protein [Rhodobacterales bacterium]|nr:glycosyltransferase family 4 protein [Rhodobacterales bacterium]